MNVIDLFSGAGGFSLGFKLAGFNIVLANEINPTIADSYSRNNPETMMVNADIKCLVDDFDGSADFPGWRNGPIKNIEWQACT